MRGLVLAESARMADRAIDNTALPSGCAASSGSAGLGDRPLLGSRRRRVAQITLATLLICGAATALVWLRPSHHSLRVARDRLLFASVTRGVFEDFIPLTATAAPPRSVFLDVPQGGRVEKILVEPGAAVAQGELLVQLSNPQLQLDVISREAQVSEQLNNLRNTELALAQARLDQQGAMIEIETQIERFEASSRRLHALWDQQLVANQEVEESDRQLRYYQNRRAFLREQREIGDRLRHRQLAQLTSSTTMLENHLAFAREHLHDLELRAPFAGTLSSLDVQLGQALDRGQRAGQIDLPGAFKLVARVDQFYSSRVAVGQIARLASPAHTASALRVTKLYPLVEQGQLTIDLEFTTPPPADLRRGHALQIRLFVDQTSHAVLIPNAAFLEHTGGHWVFVVSPDGRRASRRAIELGRKNPQHVEVIAGLAAGDRIVTSSYAEFTQLDELALD